MQLSTTRDIRYAICACLELLLIILLVNCLAQKSRAAGIVVSDLLSLAFNAQMLLLLFGGTYLQLVMLTNLSSLQDLEGKAAQYIAGTLSVLVASFLPIRAVRMEASKIKTWHFLVPVALTYGLALAALGTGYSPAFAYASLTTQYQQLVSLRAHTESVSSTADEFYSDEVKNFRTKDSNLPARPNVILIFTEGLSQNIVEDEREIMPNLAKLESESLFFENYYNHTFATYRGLIGQLYSGFQLDNLDENNLISLQDLFSLNSYNTVLINTEPTNSEFTEYLNAFGFDTMIGSINDEREGYADSYSDQQAYDMLFEWASSLNERSESFFLCIYTVGTHVSFDSVDEKYGDGSSALLNKFYNLDCQLGDFLEKFNNSELAENTVLVFTADHATYADSDFREAFPSYTRSESYCDEIPLCIYYKGITPEVCDADGRNSLDLAPTILDYLDLSGPNYFLGSSLFAEQASSELETVFNEESITFSTKGAAISDLGKSESSEIEAIIQNYLVAKLQENTTADEIKNVFYSGIQTSLAENDAKLEIRYMSDAQEDISQVWFFVWSVEDGQDDMICYPAQLLSDGIWIATANLQDHLTSGELCIHAYTGADSPEEFLADRSILIP